MNTEIAKQPINWLSVSVAPQIKLTVGQAGLLKAMTECVRESKPLTWDILVDTYYRYVRKTYFDKWKYKYNESATEIDCQFDILEQYKSLSGTWTYSIRPTVRQWFLVNIGTLVIKGKLITIPVIDIEE